MKLDIQKLSSGYIRLQGNGPCNWAQVPYWPCDEDTIRAGAFPEASEDFIDAAVLAASRAPEEVA